jgi:hypothetical protein
MTTAAQDSFRKTTQELAPGVYVPATDGNAYDLYPAFALDEGLIGLGWESLAEQLAGAGRVTIDGFGGVMWENLRERLDAALRARGIAA